MSCGVLYLHWGDVDSLLERSIASVKKWHPELPIHVEKLPDNSSYIDKARMYELSPFDTTAYLDADTVLLGRIDYALDRAGKFGLACCINEAPWARRYPSHNGDSIEYNAGVLFFDKLKFADTAKEWRACAGTIDSSCYFNTRNGRRQQVCNDQAGLTYAIEKTGLNPHVLPLNWNFRQAWQRTFCGPIKIWHDYSDPPKDVVDKSRHESDSRMLDFVYIHEAQHEEPSVEQKALKIACAMSVPRLGLMDNFFCWVEGLRPFGICPQRFTGVFWGQCLERVMEDQLQSDYILTVDYDTVFRKQDVQRLLELAAKFPEADAIVPIQPRRGTGQPLMTIADDNGNVVTEIAPEAWKQPLMRITTGHFGLTLIKTEALKKTEHPWFLGIPDKDGRWGDGKVDDDMYFWKKWHRDGRKVFLATQVAIGHMETVVSWTMDDGDKFGVHHQQVCDYHKNGKPEGVW